jgi:RNA ligase (TIGR02306 family)
LPLHSFGIDVSVEVGTDVSEVIKITKYEKPLNPALSGDAVGHFPSFIRKTDEENVRGRKEYLNEMKDSPYYISMKMDGSSGTFFSKDETFGVCSRNLNLKDSERSAFWMMERKYSIISALRKLPYNAAVQGEVYGPSINGNNLKEKEVCLALFNLWNIDEQRYMDFSDLEAFCAEFNIPMVPVLEVKDTFNYTMSDLIDKANSLKYPCGNWAEGIVVRPLINRNHYRLGRVSFKVISEPFMLKNGE